MASAAKLAVTSPEQDAAGLAAAPTRYIVPQDLALALRMMEDSEFDCLLTSVGSEAQRRGRLPDVPASEMLATDGKARLKSGSEQKNPSSSLTSGQTNAVRAAFKAGVKLSVIARQFGLSPAQVKSALG